MREMIPSEPHEDAMMMADLAYIEATKYRLSPPECTRWAVRGYLFAMAHGEQFGDDGGLLWPSLDELRKHLMEYATGQKL